MKVCVFGYGLMGRTHAKMYASHPFVNQVTVVEPNENLFVYEESNINFKSKLNGSEKFDVVSICTPTYNHKNTFLKAKDVTRAILIEKPLARTLDEALQIKTAAEKSGVSVYCAFVERFNPLLEQLKFQHKRAKYTFIRVASIPEQSWYHDLTKSGGPLLDLGSHDLDLAMWITNSSVSLIDVKMENELYNVKLILSDGSQASIITGWIKTQGYFENSIAINDKQVFGTEELDQQRYPSAYRQQINAFLKVLTGEQNQLASLDEALKVMEVYEKAHLLIK